MKASAKVHLSLIAAASLAWGLGADPARAADVRTTTPSANAASVVQLNEEGAALYGARDYRRAIEKFIQAYAIDSDPNLLFNIARCYEELGEIDAAIEKYEAFLKTPGADARGRQRARESLRALKDSKNVTPSTESTQQTHQVAPSAAPESQPTNNGNTGDSAGGTSALPWLTLGGSVVFAAVGTTFYVLGAGDHSQITDAAGYDDPEGVSPMTRRQADDLVSSGNSKKLIGGISLGVAGALAVTYVALVLSEDDDDEVAEPSLGFSVTPGRSGAAVSVQGSF